MRTVPPYVQYGLPSTVADPLNRIVCAIDTTMVTSPAVGCGADEVQRPTNAMGGGDSSSEGKTDADVASRQQKSISVFKRTR